MVEEESQSDAMRELEWPFPALTVEKVSRAKECGWLLEAGNGKEQGLS